MVLQNKAFVSRNGLGEGVKKTRRCLKFHFATPNTEFTQILLGCKGIQRGMSISQTSKGIRNWLGK